MFDDSVHVVRDASLSASPPFPLTLIRGWWGWCDPAEVGEDLITLPEGRYFISVFTSKDVDVRARRISWLPGPHLPDCVTFCAGMSCRYGVGRFMIWMGGRGRHRVETGRL